MTFDDGDNLNDLFGEGSDAEFEGSGEDLTSDDEGEVTEAEAAEYLDDDEAEEAEEVQQPEPEPAPEPAAEPEPAPEPASEPEPEPAAPKEVPLSVMLDERDRRKAAEARAREAEEKLAAQQAEPVKRPDVLDNPDDFATSVVKEADSKSEDRFYRHSKAVKIREVGEEAYNEAATAVGEALKSDPTIAQRIMQADDPGHETYEIGRSILERQSFDPEAERARIRREEEERAQKQAQTATTQVQERQQSRPDSLAGEPTTGGAKPAEWREPTDAEIFGGKDDDDW